MCKKYKLFFFKGPPSYEESTRDNVVETGIEHNSLLLFQSSSTQEKPSLLPAPSSLAQKRTEEMVKNQLRQISKIKNKNIY